MTRRPPDLLADVETQVARLFAEKQAAIALLAMTLVAHLAVAQFMLLRVQSVATEAATAPSPSERFDVRCLAGRLADLDGALVDVEALRDRSVVVHLDAATNSCLASLAPVPVSALVVGVPALP